MTNNLKPSFRETAFKPLSAQKGGSPYDTHVGKWAIDQIIDEGFALSKTPTVDAYKRQFYELTDTESGETIRLQLSGGLDFVEVRAASKTVKGDGWTVEKDALKAYLVA